MWRVAFAEDAPMRMRTLFHLILACLIAGALAAPAASAHSSRHDRGEKRGDSRDHDRQGRRGRGQASFFGATGKTECTRDPWSCDFVFSRSESAELHQRLHWVLTEHMDYVDRLASRLCDRASNENDCAGAFVAGLWNGLDALEMAGIEGSCGALTLGWTKSDGLSQTWSTTQEKCTD